MYVLKKLLWKHYGKKCMGLEIGNVLNSSRYYFLLDSNMDLALELFFLNNYSELPLSLQQDHLLSFFTYLLIYMEDHRNTPLITSRHV